MIRQTVLRFRVQLTRKTGAYRVYTQSNYNIGLVMHLLNHSSEAMTLAYLGLDQASQETMLDQIDFGRY